MRRTGCLACLIGVLIAGACRDGVGPASVRACADTTTTLTPAETTITVGQHFVAKAQSFTCHGAQPIDDEFSWATRNGEVAVIHQTTKVVDAIGPGTTLLEAVPFRSPQRGLFITVRVTRP